MTSGQKGKFNSTWDCIRKIYQEGKIKAFFKGGAANVAGGITGAAVLSIYDKFKLEIYERKDKH